MEKNATIFFSIVFIVVWNATVFFAKAEGRNNYSQEEKALRSSIMQFLSSWLVERNANSAISSFGEKAFENKVIFDDECCGYIRDADRNSIDRIKNGILQFLEDNDAIPINNDLHDILDYKALLQLETKLAKKNIAELNRDRYLLFRSNSRDISNLLSRSKSRKYLNEYLKSTNPIYLSMVSINGGIIYFAWSKESDGWKICHASIICM